MKINIFNHASIKLEDNIKVYFDPYQIKENYHDADYIFITHDHYDHYDEESINNIINENTTVILPKCLENKKNIYNNVLIVEPNKVYKLSNLSFETINSYNKNAPFHPKEKDYLGYNVLINETKFYVMGDTDRTEETDLVKTDICFVPIGGTYTMNVKEASEYINYLKPKKAIPIHYGSIVGDKSLAEEFKKLIDKEIEVEILL